jgi:hypothetical protein
MTEEEWLSCAEPAPMLEFLRGKTSDRKVRLFIHACIWHVLPFAEQGVVDGWKGRASWSIGDPTDAVNEITKYAGSRAAKVIQGTAKERLAFFYCFRNEQGTRQSNSLRCIFGSLPFRPVTIEPAWITPTVKQLAGAIYEERAFDRLPILADALEEAGCTDADILNHCRQPGEHVRGCWVIDLILSKDR